MLDGATACKDSLLGFQSAANIVSRLHSVEERYGLCRRDRLAGLAVNVADGALEGRVVPMCSTLANHVEHAIGGWPFLTSVSLSGH